MSLKERIRSIACQPVFDGEPILYVSHDADGDWQFLCGKVHEDGKEEGRVVGSSDMIERDQTLLELESLPLGWHATREKVGGEWRRIVNKS